MSSQQSWKRQVGRYPYRVTVFENVNRDGVLYLRWTGTDGKKRHESLAKKLRTADGRIIKVTEKWALERANAKHALLAANDGQLPTIESEAAGPSQAPGLTIEQAWDRVSDRHTGKYPVDTQHRREVKRALDFAAKIWGPTREWNSIRRSDIRHLGRARVDELRADHKTGWRGAEVFVTRVLTVAKWLRDEELISEAAALPYDAWREELQRYWTEVTGEVSVPDPQRPRHTPEEIERIMERDREVDPRLHLLLEIGAEGRGGQVRRLRRSNLLLDVKEGDPDAYGRVIVKGKGKKKGLKIDLTKGQRSAIDYELTEGYLRLLEQQHKVTGADYPLFPAGQMPGGRKREKVHAVPDRHMDVTRIATMSAFIGWLHDAEELAEVAHMDGRKFYGVRRTRVDQAKKERISREGLQQYGGWSDAQMPDQIYAEQQADYAVKEARDVRAKVRKENQ